MKFRIIPIILTDGLTVVKGQNFDNWRTVGNLQAIARLFASRDVDELMFLDVNARKNNNVISSKLINYFSEIMQVPFSIGGGISSIEHATLCLRNGAEKIVLGTSALENPKLITEIADKFGSQAVIIALDINSFADPTLYSYSGMKANSIDVEEFLIMAERMGAGEFLIQSVSADGTLSGFDPRIIKKLSKLTRKPIIASGGIANSTDVQKAVHAGASAVGIGALFHFTEITPNVIAKELNEMGIQTRSK